MRTLLCSILFMVAACGRSAPPTSQATTPAVTPAAATDHSAEAASIIAEGKAMLDPTKALPKPRKVAARWEEACERGLVDVCVELARAWQAGDLYFAQCPDSYGGSGIDAANPARARSFYEKACKAGHRDACAEMTTLGTTEPACI